MTHEPAEPVRQTFIRDLDRQRSSEPAMIITGIETVPLRIPYKPGREPAASVWGAAGSPAVDSLLVKVTTDQGCGARPSGSWGSL